ncbi:MAG: MFS transporter [Acidobacteria bacterium]|nr:MFS transporter [Acidobacteriota bacterium]
MKRLISKGDINAFFGLMLDNVTNLVVLTGILYGAFAFPMDVILKKMIPGTALGVMFGDIVYTIMAYRLSRKTGSNTVTAMPLGLDTPSTVGIALTVLGPVYLQTHDANLTLYVGMAVMVLMGLMKVVFSFFGKWIQEKMPRAGLLGSIGGIGIALLGLFPMLEVFKLPVVGITSLGIIIYAFFAKGRLPFRVPPVLAAVAVGTLLFYLIPHTHGSIASGTALGIYIPYPSLGFLKGMKLALNYIPIALPFGLLTIIGGINVTESARVAGDDFNTTQILFTEAIATILAGLCGGVAQSTPYIGHPAYKDMGAKAGYTLATGLFIGIGGMLGIISGIVQIIPPAAVAPILIFVGFEIAAQSIETAEGDLSAVLLAFIPSIADLVLIQMNSLLGSLGKGIADLSMDMASTLKAVTVLGNGFILTAMLWGSAVSFLIQRKMKGFALTMAATVILTLFGIIHSVRPDGGIYLPDFTHYGYSDKIALGYLIFAAISMLSYWWVKREELNA